MSFLAGPVVQLASKKKSSVQQEELTVAQHNWLVICTYGTNEREISRWAFDAGYNTETAPGAIIRAIESTKWSRRKIAHIKGGKGSNTRGGTMEEIDECKAAIKEWLEANPA